MQTVRLWGWSEGAPWVWAPQGALWKAWRFVKTERVLAMVTDADGQRLAVREIRTDQHSAREQATGRSAVFSEPG